MRTLFSSRRLTLGPEMASSARALCQDTHCKKDGAKIPKGELRFGTWAAYQEDRGSWKWKHWYAPCSNPVFCTALINLSARGCISGLQMQQAYELCDREGDGNLQFDFLDGYDELEYVWTVPLSTIARVRV